MVRERLEALLELLECWSMLNIDLSPDRLGRGLPEATPSLNACTKHRKTLPLVPEILKLQARILTCAVRRIVF